VKARINFAVDAVVIAVYLVATNPSTTGTPVHEWVGIGSGLVAFVHLVLHWEWAVRIASRFFRRLGAAPRVNFVIDALALVAFVTVGLSGLLVSRSVLRPFGLIVDEESIWHAVHSQSATVLLALIGIHLGLHWGWIASAFRHRIFRPLLDPVGALDQLRARAAAHSAAGAADDRPRPMLRHGVRRCLAAAALVAVTAGAVHGVAVGAGDRLLVEWLTVPGGAGTGLSARGTGAATRSDAVSPDTPRGGAQTDARVDAAIRGSHAFGVLGISMMMAVGLGGLLRPR